MLRLNICSIVLLPWRKPACSSAMMFPAWGFSLHNNDFQHNFAAVADQADGAVVIAQLKFAFLRYGDDDRFCPC